MKHIPVLQKEVIEYLDPKPDENFIDCTVGLAGHSFAILEKTGPEGKILGIDWSQEVLRNAKYRIQNTEYKNRIILVCDNFANLKEIAREKKFGPVSGILLDLGMSSWHLEESKKGFSFGRAERRTRDEWSSSNQREEPLDMRYNPESGKVPAEEILNSWPEPEIRKILEEYGDERFAGRIAAAVVKKRKIKPIRTTFQLAEVLREATPDWYHHQKIHFATRTFQALRIAVNGELENLKSVLPQAIELLERQGRLLVISFHSLEDKIVKNFFKENSKGRLVILTNKPVRPAAEEIKINPRSRSARLRAAQKC
jgi:16S rRNA (cytosine1402-N4)-methyltransferase